MLPCRATQGMGHIFLRVDRVGVDLPVGCGMMKHRLVCSSLLLAGKLPLMLRALLCAIATQWDQVTDASH